MECSYDEICEQGKSGGTSKKAELDKRSDTSTRHFSRGVGLRKASAPIKSICL